MRKRKRKLTRTRLPAKTRPPAWYEMVAHEPELNDLLVEARSITSNGSYFCNHEAYAFGCQGHESFKQRLELLVGFGSRHRGSFLGTSQAWDEAVETIIEALPPCYNCGCVCLDADNNLTFG